MTKETINGRAAADMPCCGVYAVAHLAGRPIGEFFNTARKLLGRSGSWKGRTWWRERAVMLDHCGLAYQDASPPQWYPRITLKTWARRHAQPGVTYLVDTTGHTQVVRDGFVTDQCGTRRIGEQVLKMRSYFGTFRITKASHRQDMKHVRNVWRISGAVVHRVA